MTDISFEKVAEAVLDVLGEVSETLYGLDKQAKDQAAARQREDLLSQALLKTAANLTVQGDQKLYKTQNSFNKLASAIATREGCLNLIGHLHQHIANLSKQAAQTQTFEPGKAVKTASFRDETPGQRMLSSAERAWLEG
jgi:alpha-D-ribose 1-methylphosphonate 5-triphosphate diphosphatase PhnM